MNSKVKNFENSIEYELMCSDFGMRLFEQYKLEDKIYESSISQIHLLYENLTGELFTLKVITNKDMFGDLEILKQIDHKNIVRVKSIFTTDKYVFIIQDYIKGITLKDYVEKNGLLSEKQTIDIGLQLCRIFEYLHTFAQSPLIYRDLKPANIIISEDGEIKLIDLASIRRFKMEAEHDTIHIGTVGFSPPEQFGYGQTDIRSDIYTIGATLYYLVTGKKPINDKLKVKGVKSIRTDISLGLASVIDKCTRFSPNERYQNSNELNHILMQIDKKSILTQLRFAAGRKNVKTLSLLLISIIIVALTFTYFLQRYDASIEASNKIAQEASEKLAKISESEAAAEAKAAAEFSFDKTTIKEAFWSGSLPQKLTRNMQSMFEEGPSSEYSDNTFHIAIVEWDNTKDYKQMAERIFRVDSKLILRAEGYKDVQADISPGSLTQGNGAGQVYVCFLSNKENMVSGVKYKLIDESGHWIIPEDMYIERIEK